MIAGFALSGFLLALLGATLPGSRYQYSEQYASAAWLFVALSAGTGLAGELRRRLMPRLPPKRLRVLACFLVAAAFVLSGILPPVALWLTAGLSSGFLNISLFESIHLSYAADPASTVVRAGVSFGAGCLLSATAVAATLRWGANLPQASAFLALVPALFGWFYLREPDRSAPLGAEPRFRDALREFSRPGALIFAALLLFQSGSEWTVAGWLPLFLTHRLGISPEHSLWMLALYWLALLLGRLANIYLLAHIRHGRILLGSTAAALLGCILLAFAGNTFGAAVSIVLLGAGFAAVYPLLAEKTGRRFPDYHAGVFNGIFSIALAGGLLFPAAAGLLAQAAGLASIMAIPALGVFLVVALLLVLWLESKVTGR